MARKLPWASSGQSKPTQERGKTPDKRNDADQDQVRGRSKNTTIKQRKRSRSHSTSPPPGPPPVELMHEGFEEDDIWMIVEDEFEAIAKSFTAHLHHAQYKKLVKKARDAPPKALPTAASPMSKETRRRLQRETLHYKQQEAVDGIGAGPRNGISDDHVDDPWRGTSIAGLIASGSQEKRSLKGIDRLPSSTRAAQGFTRPGSRDGAQADAEPVHQQKRLKIPEATEAESSEHTRASAQSGLPRYVNGNSPPRPVDGRSRTRTTATNNTSRQATNDTTSTTPRPAKTSLLAKRKQPKKEESKEDRLSEVPMFLF